MKKIFIAPMTIALLVAVVAGAACSSESTPKEPTLSDLIFCSEEPAGKTNYEEQPNATYGVGETIWMGLQVDGIEVGKQYDGDNIVTIILVIRVIDANGDTVDEEVESKGVEIVSGSEYPIC
jgi:hypothetical protein